MRPLLPIACLFTLVQLVAACAADGDDAGDDLPSFDGLDAEVAAAVADIAASTGVAEGDIEVVAADHVTWPDGSIGCPQPGEMYTQALVDGYRIVLRADGDEVVYHGEDGGDPMRCDDPQPPVD